MDMQDGPACGGIRTHNNQRLSTEQQTASGATRTPLFFKEFGLFRFQQTSFSPPSLMYSLQLSILPLGMRAAIALAAAAVRPAATEMSKRAMFRAIPPSPRWLDRIAELDVGRVRRPKLPKVRRGGDSDVDHVTSSGRRSEHPAGALFTKLKLMCRVTSPQELPPEGSPEIAFCGR